MRLGNRSALWVALCALSSGCYSGVTVNLGEDAGAGTGGVDEPAGEDDDEDDGDSSGGVDVDDSCEVLELGPSPMRRLTRAEYNNTVRDLLRDEGRPADAFIADEVVAGFEANTVAPLSEAQLVEYMDAAEVLADRAVAERWESVVGCAASDAECLRTFVVDFGARAFRRPLSETERADYLALFEGVEGTPEEAIALVVQAFLVSPSFLYHVEVGGDEVDGMVRLGDYEIASRLSYFLWSSMPDDELFDLAAAGMLTDPDTRATQAERMLEDDRALDSIASFHRQWLGASELELRVKDPALFPEWGAPLAEAMEAETVAFADEVIRRGDGSLETLLTADWSIISPDLAEIYGVETPVAGMQRVELDPQTRSGVLTHASLLTKTSHAANNSWVFRGLFVREKLLCSEFPPPPDNVEANETNDPGRLDNPECAGCHTLLDPVGQGFDAYSPIGVFRTTDESGESVSGRGEFLDLPEIGPFDGPVELGKKLATHQLVTDCVATQWFRYVNRRHEDEADECGLDELRVRFAESGGDIPTLISDLVRSENFEFRAAEDMP